ncbi:hypothetical protein COCVIDRAFT_86378, partial [Bipolaris victoriae FI3]
RHPSTRVNEKDRTRNGDNGGCVFLLPFSSELCFSLFLNPTHTPHTPHAPFLFFLSLFSSVLYRRR